MASLPISPSGDKREAARLLTTHGPALERELARHTRDELRAMFADEPLRAIHLINVRELAFGSAIEREVAKYTRDELRTLFRDDPWRANYLINIREYLSGEAVLTTYPWNTCIPVADVCNARCPFCTSWFQGTRCILLDEVDRFTPVLRRAKLLGLAGHGEPLLHPQFEALGQKLTSILDPRCEAYLITNGLLLDRFTDVLLRFNKGFTISLNAATPETHHDVMHLGPQALPRVLEAIRHLVHVRDTTDPLVDVSISFVVINQNLHELVGFIELANELRVNRMYVRTLAPQSYLPAALNYHTLPPYRHADFEAHLAAAESAARTSIVPIVGDFNSLRTPIFPAALERQIEEHPPQIIPMSEAIRDRSFRSASASVRPSTRGRALPGHAPGSHPESIENIYARSPRFMCKAPYQNLYINDFDFRMSPCCYMTNVPDFEATHYDGGFDFFDVWNSPAMVELRQRLKNGPLLGPCLRCPPVY